MADEYHVFFNKAGIKARDFDCRWEWESSIHCDNLNDKCTEKDYLVTINRLYNDQGNVDASIKFYLDGEIDGKPYAWCFYNSEDSLVYKYIINPETHNDINLYYELLKINNEELSSLLLKHKKHKAVFDNSSYKFATQI